MGVEHLGKLALRNGANALIDDFPALEQKQGRDATYLEAERSLLVVIYIQLANLSFAIVLRGQSIDRRSQHPARAAPFGPEINQHRLIGLKYVLIEAGVRKSQCVWSCHFYLLFISFDVEVAVWDSKPSIQGDILLC